MSLSLVFRLQAALFTFFGAMMLLAPGALMGSFNVEGSAIAEDIMRGMSLMALGMAYISWQMPSWAAEQHKVSWHVFCHTARTLGAFNFISNKYGCFSSWSC